ncbi:ribonuclease H-like domain-containing protein [Gilbertella persicaria]|uniref:ribonuclease H-like domain-containing protein n=1 Tax=Gilbertella persicaria TaxID=101096 RepID=UPI0022205881|nr:ribonuclease H-like domain-containing protein [Gilbertella persicaria]KAI8092212.1 ribonuclease H-like domain-containing protein [Gilbertella persicaria]
MEVLRSNFEEKLPVIEQAMLEADFIAIDTEFTGLTTPDIQFQNIDDIETRYSKLKSCVQEFTIIQYGVCAFKRNPETGDFMAKPFNFYIFGADTNEVYSRRIFSATPSSLSFLRSNKFDFNKLIEEGIPFYNFTEENSMFQSNQGTSVLNRRTLIKESTLTKSGKSFLEYNRNCIKKWLQSNTETPLVVQVNSNFYKRLIYQEAQDAKYNGFLQASQRDSKHIEITRIKEEDKRKKAANAPKLNFRAVIELIKKANCPVVAHNAAFDILHTVDQFWQYLPNHIEEFKKVANDMWPNIVDTKYLAEYHPSLRSCFNTSVLGSLYNTVYEELKEAGQQVVMEQGFERYVGAENEVAHEAGYDAYMTGVIYLAFMAFIREKREEDENKAEKRKRDSFEEVAKVNTHKKFKEDDDEEENKKEEEDEEEGEEEDEEEDEEEESSEEGEQSASDSDESDVEVLAKKKSSLFMDKSVTPYYGRIFLMRSDVPYINLKGEETIEVLSYPNKFYLHNIPPGLTNSAIERLYPTIQPTAISWVNDSNAWLILKDESKIPFVKLGILGLSVVQSFLPGCSRQVEGEAYGITKQAGQMELLSHEQWQALYGPKKTVNYNNTASVLLANGLSAKTNDDNAVPKGGSSYDDLDIPLPPSFTASLKRNREDGDDDINQPQTKNAKKAC